MKKRNILYTCDDAYLSLTSISIQSVVENNPDTEICFYIATEKEDSENYHRLCDFYRNEKRIRFRYLDCTKYDELLKRKGFDRWGSNSYYVYWKLFAYDGLDVDTIWYLDSDVLCLKEIEEPKIEKAVGAVLDSAHADFNRTAHIDESFYLFNTGSLYVDVKRWKERNCTEKLVKYIEGMKHQPLLCDQDILAAGLQDEVEVIDPKYNYLTGYDYYGVHNSFVMYSLDKKPFYREEEVEKARENIIFYHCLGGVFGRPWQKGNESPVRKQFEHYRKNSAWPDYETEMHPSALFKAEKVLEFLPDPIYDRIHNLAQRIYLKRLGKQ